MAEKIIMWPGVSRKQYKYWIHPLNTTLKDSPGNYIFAKETAPARWKPIYIGETDNLRDSISNHEKMYCIKRHGDVHIHVHNSSSDEELRRAEESNLITNWDPPCNKE